MLVTARVLFVLLMVSLAPLSAWSQENKSWSDIVEKAKGQTVYFNGWGGSEAINDYVLWAAEEVKNKYGITVKHVKVTDIGDVVGRILAEKSVGRTEGGSVDLIWINGENFKAMKENGLLAGAYSQLLPHYQLVDTKNKPSTLYDFTVPVDNLEVPWGMAQLVFMYDSVKVSNPPKSMDELLVFAQENPGRFTYPAPPAFHGTTFLKQILLEKIVNQEVLAHPVSQKDFDQLTKPLWQYLDKLHPLMWRQGRAFTTSSSEIMTLLDNGEIFISYSFNPNDASRAIANGELPASVRTYVHKNGTIANSHFVAIPFNSSAKEAALVFANFLISPEAQARKSDPKIWGDPTVLSMGKLNPTEKQLFDVIPTGVATLTNEELGTTYPEPHSSWVDMLEKAWLARYSH